ncbi:MAG: LacI family transcriptional regulator [Spirochaetia bacterium]|nr:LacI family transcriptional regulator [Spirochaetia bacterium]MCF7940066.1 LacI family transcriptional regulator [Spirochaetia bacterium]
MSSTEEQGSARRITSIDVARRAGVSQSTVSRALNPAGRLSEGLRQKVLAAVKELDYRPDALARGMASRNTHIIGLTINDSVSSYYYKLLKLFTKKLHEAGLQLLLFNASEDEELGSVLDRLIEYRVDSLIIVGVSVSHEFIDRCSGQGIPVIIFDRNIPDVTAHTICLNDAAGGRAVARLLYQSGHERYAFISAKEDEHSSRDRLAGYTGFLHEQGISECVVEEAGFSYDEGYAAAIRLLTDEQPPDAICCVTDIIALGVMDAARCRLGLKIPEELSVIGFDDIDEGRMDAFRLTTIGQPIVAMVDAAIELLLSWQLSTPTARGPQLFEGELILRDSVRTFRSNLPHRSREGMLQR